MIEGVLSIQSGDNPRILAEKLWSFLPPAQRETEDDEAGERRAPSGAGRARRRGGVGRGHGKRKQRHEEHPDERWLITYADVLTLMFVLFMVLFSISVVNTAKFDMLKQTLQDAFNSGLDRRAAPACWTTNPRDAAPAVIDTQLGADRARRCPIVGGIILSDASPEQVLETAQLQTAEKTIDVDARRRPASAAR